MEKRKFKVGDKFVIEVKELPMSSDGNYYLCDGNTFYPERILETLPRFPIEEESDALHMTRQQAIDEIENQVCEGCEHDCGCCAFSMAKEALKEQEDKK